MIGIKLWMIIVAILVISGPISYYMFRDEWCSYWSFCQKIGNAILSYLCGVLATLVGCLFIGLFGFVFYLLGKILYEIPWKEALNSTVF